MTPSRAKKLQTHCWEQAIRLDQSKKNGKMVPDLTVVIDIYQLLADVLKHIEESQQSNQNPNS